MTVNRRETDKSDQEEPKRDANQREIDTIVQQEQ